MAKPQAAGWLRGHTGEMPWMVNEKKQKLPPADGKHQGVVKDIPIIGEEFPPEGETIGTHETKALANPSSTTGHYYIVITHTIS